MSLEISPQFWWYLARASGIVCFVLLTASLVWGVLLHTRALRDIDRPGWLLDMHTWLSGLAIVTMILHCVALVADNYVHFGWAEILVPDASSWKTGPVTLGVIALWLLVLVQGTTLFRRWLPRKIWKFIHLFSYASWFLVALHSGLAGTDATSRAYQAVALLATIAAVSATFLRVTSPRRRPKPS